MDCRPVCQGEPSGARVLILMTVWVHAGAVQLSRKAAIAVRSMLFLLSRKINSPRTPNCSVRTPQRQRARGAAGCAARSQQDDARQDGVALVITAPPPLRIARRRGPTASGRAAAPAG